MSEETFYLYGCRREKLCVEKTPPNIGGQGGTKSERGGPLKYFTAKATTGYKKNFSQPRNHLTLFESNFGRIMYGKCYRMYIPFG